MDTSRTKYPRTYHLPWSLGATDDDKTLGSVKHFVGREVVVTEKLDGENTTLYPDSYCHARSMDSASHPSQAWVRALSASVGHNIPTGWRVCGENVYAQHSVAYDRLASYFYVFAIYNGDLCLSWDETVEWASLLGLEIVPELYRGIWDEEAIKACFTGNSAVGEASEGYVVRFADSFRYTDFRLSAAKFVREGHVAEGAKHWRQCKVTPNQLEGPEA